MFSTDDKKGSIPLAIVVGGKSDGEIVFVQTEDKSHSVVKKSPVKQITVFDGEFEQLPSEEIRVLYIAGSSGSGKSYYAAKYIQKYRKLYPKSKFFLFSCLKEDPVLDKLKPHRITISEELVENPIELDEVIEGSIVLFDDIDVVSNKEIQKSVNKIKDQILQLGRHKNIKIIITSHLVNGNDRNTTRVIMSEMQSFTFFPKSGSIFQIKYCLKQYFGMSATQITKVLKLDSRWVTITKVYPQVIISEHECIFMNIL